MARFKNFVQHASAFMTVALPVLVALEAVPGPLGKVAAVLAGGVGALVQRAQKPVGAP